jgi:hypothetical protein
MSSDDQSDIDQSSTLPLPFSVPNQKEHIERIVNNQGLRIFLIIDYTANLRKNSKIFTIWHYGGERRRLDNNNIISYWRCHHCIGNATVLKIDGNGGQTTYALLHLKNKHNIDCKADDEAVPSNIAGFSATASAGASAITTLASKAVR